MKTAKIAFAIWPRNFRTTGQKYFVVMERVWNNINRSLRIVLTDKFILFSNLREFIFYCTDTSIVKELFFVMNGEKNSPALSVNKLTRYREFSPSGCLFSFFLIFLEVKAKIKIFVSSSNRWEYGTLKRNKFVFFRRLIWNTHCFFGSVKNKQNNKI